jgi:hypothetical protein
MCSMVGEGVAKDLPWEVQSGLRRTGLWHRHGAVLPRVSYHELVPIWVNFRQLVGKQHRHEPALLGDILAWPRRGLNRLHEKRGE